MKSRKVKATAKSHAFLEKKKLRGNLALEVSDDSASDFDPSSFYQDEIDDYHRKKEEELSTDDEVIARDDDSSEQEEVLPITDDETDEKHSERRPEKSDSESDYDHEKDLPNLDAWGKRKSTYYSADFVDEDRGKSYREEDALAAQAEEEGALAMQKSLASTITAESFASIYSKFDGPAESSDEEQEDMVPDWNSASVSEKIKFMKKTSPEFLVFIEEFKEKLTEAKDCIIPLLDLCQQGKFPSYKCESYLMLKYQLLMHFCMNVSFYMALKSQGSVVSNHPVMKRILTYKSLLDQLKPTDDKLKPEMDIILHKLKSGQQITTTESNGPVQNGDLNEKLVVLAHPQRPLNETEEKTVNVQERVMDISKTSKKRKHVQFETEHEKEILSLYAKKQQKIQKVKNSEKMDDIQETNENSNVDDQDQSENDYDDNDDGDTTQDKRKITYQISKNKGLTRHRKKEYRNPRIRNKMKFKRAQKKRKGQVREPTRELKRYDGEATGISTHVVRSIKLK